ncbi:MAG: hypothetical protein FE78DRAFT_532991 [Acidomyces sp. 'richmondensis']|nr:MAG: hypothetical protein FE78DRAFT_532991 [Acidomyces sp. 'richmondensis']
MRKSPHNILVLNNYESHISREFRSFCKENNIILLWMLPHSSHLLQLLDIGCFGPLRQPSQNRTRL